MRSAIPSSLTLGALQAERLALRSVAAPLARCKPIPRKTAFRVRGCPAASSVFPTAPSLAPVWQAHRAVKGQALDRSLGRTAELVDMLSREPNETGSLKTVAPVGRTCSPSWHMVVYL